jgi:hypothetical protein
MEESAEKLSSETRPTDSEEVVTHKLGLGWAKSGTQVACSTCQAVYLDFASSPRRMCPNCLNPGLLDIQEDERTTPLDPPELILPFSVQEEQISQALQKFAAGIPYPPQDLNAGTLTSRLVPVYLPLWLVDARVEAQWQAEVGFDYEVVSHREHFNQNSGTWITQEIKEKRIRWEPRLGNLSRKYENIPAPALEHERKLQAITGGLELTSARPYRPDDLQDNCFLALPNRHQSDAWSEAVLEIQKIAAEECRQATDADHQRNFKWQPQFPERNWTLFLRPVYSSYYLDDDGMPQPVLINGVSGQLTGKRKASFKHAQAQAMNILIVAAIIFMIGLLLGGVGLIFPPLLVAGGFLLVAGTFTALGALVPLIHVWQFNQQTRTQGS